MTAKKLKLYDYEGFLKKFEPKKTTDDCYTPPEVYEVVLKHVSEKVDLTGKNIVRPFYPDIYYENYDYQSYDVVIDNPPFSILAKIIRFYCNRNIPFFLFANHKTLFNFGKQKCTLVVVGANIIYENGASIPTSFITNLFGSEIKIIGDAELREKLDALNPQKRRPVYEYPKEVINFSRIEKIVKRGVNVEIRTESLFPISELKSQKVIGKSIYGGGFLLSEKAQLYIEILENETSEQPIFWGISEYEKKIIQNLK